jgi:excisionase family DNA binding protein
MIARTFSNVDPARGDQPPHVPEPLWLTVEAAAALVSLGRSSIYQAMQRGELRWRPFGRARRIARTDLIAWAEAGTVGGWAMAQDSGCGSPVFAREITGPNGTYSHDTATANGNGGPNR